MWGHFVGFVLILITVATALLGMVSATMGSDDEQVEHIDEPKRYPSTSVGSRTGYNYNLQNPAGNLRSSVQKFGKPLQEDEIGLLLNKLSSVSSSMKESMPILGSQADNPTQFPPPPPGRYNSLTRISGGHSLSYKPGCGGRYYPTGERYATNYNAPPPGRYNSLTPINGGQSLSFNPGGRYDPTGDRYATNYNMPPPSKSKGVGDGKESGWYKVGSDGRLTPAPKGEGFFATISTKSRTGQSTGPYGDKNANDKPVSSGPPTSGGGKESGWFKVGSDGQLTPAPKGEGFFATISTESRTGARTQPSARPFSLGGYSQSTDPYGDKNANYKPVSSGAPTPRPDSQSTGPYGDKNANDKPVSSGAPTSGGGKESGWYKVGSDGRLTPAPKGEGFFATISTEPRTGAPIRTSARPFSLGGYSQSTDPHGDKNANARPVSPGAPTPRPYSQSMDPYGDKNANAKPVSPEKDDRDEVDAAKKILMGLFGTVDDGADNIGPPRFKPLPSLGKPFKPSDSNGLQRPKPREPTTPSKPNVPESPVTGWFQFGPNGQFVPAPEGQGFRGTLSPLPESGPSGNPGLGDNNRQGVAAGRGPMTKSGKRVGTSKGITTKVIDGRIRQVEEWVLNPREQLELAAEPQGDLTMLGKFSTDPSAASQLATYQGPTKNIDLYSFYESPYKDKWNDPSWNLQWYMHDYRTKDGPVMDMNVVPAWELGYTGKGVKIAVVDDGIMHGHPDLAPNHLLDMSYDYSVGKVGSQPTEPFAEHSHGTKCASLIAMVAGNGLCGVGMAYDAKVAGVISNVGKLTNEYLASRSFTHRLEDMDISSNSYGPSDDGIHMQRAPHLTYVAMLKGITEGRGNKGLVYVFPTGNGREDGDHCGADAYMNTRYTVGIASATQHGKDAPYSERCAGVLAAAYSSGGPRDEHTVTVEMANNCNDTFGGTSAAVPLASAIIALMLQANPELTYRDVMHIITMGSEVAPLADNPNTWKRNGAGFWVSHEFGFGLLNAKNLVLLAKDWSHVPVEHNSCDVKIPMSGPAQLSTGHTTTMGVRADGCPGAHSVKWIENIEIKTTIHYGYRGALSISLTSPSGTVSNLLEVRRKDNENGMRNWIFRTVQHWGENPTGRWVFKVCGNALDGLPALHGSVDEVVLSFHGMAVDPPHQKNLPRTYAAFRLLDGRSSQDSMPTRVG